MEDILETWKINNRINIYLLNAIEKDEYLDDTTANKGRNVGQQFSHMHNVRLMWLKEAAPELFEREKKIEKENSISKKLLEDYLISSGKAIEELLKKGFSDNRIKGFKPNPLAFLGYLISHESHHRGQLIISLKTCGHPISKKHGFGLWQWGTR